MSFGIIGLLAMSEGTTAASTGVSSDARPKVQSSIYALASADRHIRKVSDIGTRRALIAIIERALYLLRRI